MATRLSQLLVWLVWRFASWGGGAVGGCQGTGAERSLWAWLGVVSGQGPALGAGGRSCLKAVVRLHKAKGGFNGNIGKCQVQREWQREDQALADKAIRI